MSLVKYIESFSRLRTDKNRKRWSALTTYQAPHKPFLLLSIMDLIAQGQKWGSDHAKCLIICKKSSLNGCCLVLNMPFWVQNCKSKELKILALSKGTTC